jgi:hypothetical protein
MSCDDAGDIEGEFGSRDACAGGGIAMASEATGIIDCQGGSGGRGAAVVCDAAGGGEGDFGMRTANAGCGAAAACDDAGNTPYVILIPTLPVLLVMLLWRAALQASAQALPVFVVSSPRHARVQTLLSTKSVHALPVLVVMMWRARLQVTSNANSVQALPAPMVLLPRWVTRQAT